MKGPEKSVPWSIFEAPEEIVASFLQGLFDVDGCAVVNREKGSYVGLGSASKVLLRGVQVLLTTFGISSRIYKVRDASEVGAFTYIAKSGANTTYGQLASYDLRITSGSLVAFATHIGFSISRKRALLDEIIFSQQRTYDVRRTARLVWEFEDGVELTYNLSEPRNHSYVVDGIVVRNCSEYMHLDNSACNLASINLMKFLNDDDSFDVDGFRAAVEVVFSAQEILVGNADYPTEKIAENSRRYRELGIGYANLGALLMAQGLPYDSDEGRAWAASITALMTGHAYATSSRIAARMGPFAGYHADSEAMLNVLRMHRAEVAKVDEEVVPPELLSAAQEAWDEAVEASEQFGVRNSQASVLAPTGTIALLMDCDTTGIEPDLSLVKTKKLVGGGTMSIVNQTVPRALTQLGYSPAQVDDIVTYIDEHKSIVGAPHLSSAHLPVFACSMGDNTIHYLGHVRMMAAVQPFISGADHQDDQHSRGRECRGRRAGPSRCLEDGIEGGRRYSRQLQGGSTAVHHQEGWQDRGRGVPEATSPLPAQKQKPATGRWRQRFSSSRLPSPASSYASRDVGRRCRPREHLSAQSVGPARSHFGRGLRGIRHGGGIRRRPTGRGVPSRFPSRGRPWPGSWMPSRSRSAWDSSTGYRLRPTSPSTATCASSRQVSPTTPTFVLPPVCSTTSSGVWRSTTCRRERARGTRSPVDFGAPAADSSRSRGSRDTRARPGRGDWCELRAADGKGGSSSRGVEPGSIQRPEQRDAPLCYQCGMVMQRAGSCYVCTSCGTTSGCS